MANSKKACRYCKKSRDQHKMVKVPLGAFCNWGCAVEYKKDMELE